MTSVCLLTTRLQQSLRIGIRHHNFGRSSVQLIPTFVGSNDIQPIVTVPSNNLLHSFSTSVRYDDSNNSIPTIADIQTMSNDELEDTSTIPGWQLVHSPPRKFPRGALIGTVVSDKMDKTVNVAVDRYRIVPKVRKRVRYTRKFMAHDEEEVANLGDLVMITPCHRISKHKHFMLREIIRPKGQL